MKSILLRTALVLAAGPTIYGRRLNVVLRMYGALEPWFNETWRPGEIGLVE